MPATLNTSPPITVVQLDGVHSQAVLVVAEVNQAASLVVAAAEVAGITTTKIGMIRRGLTTI
jgi:hypothetical protein